MARFGWGDLTEPFLFTFNSNCQFLKNFLCLTGFSIFWFV